MALTRRERAKYFRWVQYAIGIVILIVIGFLADWSAFAKAFLNFDVALEMFPEVITTGLKNTLIYTACSAALTSNCSAACPHCSCCSWSPSAFRARSPASSFREASTAR